MEVEQIAQGPFYDLWLIHNQEGGLEWWQGVCDCGSFTTAGLNRDYVIGRLDRHGKTHA